MRFIQRNEKEPGEAIKALSLPPILERLLAIRGFEEKETVERFLDPKLSDLHDPMLLSDMPRAVSLIEEAIAGNRRVTVYGDYDVDGMCATAILHTYLKKRGAQVAFYIPSRHEEGYGLNLEAVRSIADKSDLLITVDCGITSVSEVALARELGLTVIVTDHHQLGPELPPADAVVNPILAGYPFAKLCGAGVVWKMVWALGGEAAAMPLVDLAALATVADLVPLLEENRVIVAEGLRALQGTGRPGLRALIEVAGLTGREITSGHLGYQLAPRLNAAGRLKDAGQGVTLLTCRNPEQARAIALELDANNTERRALELRMFEEALAKIPTEMDFMELRCIVLCGEGWNPGVIGLVASRLVEKYHWPVVMLARQGEGCTGSARSIPGINIHTALSSCRDLFDRFGGHAAAAGLHMPYTNVEIFRRRLSAAIAEQEKRDTFLPSEDYDLEVELSQVDESLISEMGRFAPTGMGNPAPVLLTHGASVSAARTVGKDQAHLKLSLSQGEETREAIAFRMGALAPELPEQVDVLFAPSLNTWMDQRSVQLEIRALQATAPAKAFRDHCMAQEQRFLRAIYTQILYNSSIIIEDGEEPRAEWMDTASLERALGEAVAESLQGVLMLAQTASAVRKWIVRLNVVGAELSYRLGTAEDPRLFHTLLAAPDFPLSPGGTPRVIALLDGVFSQRQLAAVRRAYPKSKLWVCKDAGSQRAQALSDLVPGDEALRSLYRCMRGVGEGTVRQLAASSGMGLAQIELSLDVFEQLQLAQRMPQTARWKLLPPRKCDLMESAILRQMRDALQGKDGEPKGETL